MKKEEGIPKLKLIDNPDILKSISFHKKRPKLVVGFAAETMHLTQNAMKKIKQKKCDFIIANNVANSKEVFGSNMNEVTIMNTKGIFLKGYLENDYKKLQIVNNKEYYGSRNLNNNSISIGKELSIYLNVNIDDKITVMSPAGIQTLVGTLPKQETFKIISIFDSGLSEFNENIAYINLETLENFFNKNKDL